MSPESFLRKTRVPIRVVCIYFLLLETCGSATAHRYVLDVPFFAQQEDRDCGITSLRVLLTYSGDRAALAALETLRAPQGLMPVEIEQFLQTHGVPFRRLGGSSPDLMEAIRSATPVLALLNLSRGPYRRFHYVVIVGLETDDRGSVRAFLIHDGRTPARRVTESWFRTRWERARAWAIGVGKGRGQ